MAEIRINTTGGLKLYDADNSHYAQIVAGTITSNVDAITLGHDTVTIADNLSLASDSSIIKFGADSEITLTHSADSGLLLKHTATADDKPINLILQTGETDMAADDVIGKISFQAPDEGTGTDAILVSAAIQAVAEGDHSSSSNATRLEFHTGASELATSQMTISSGGIVGIGAVPKGDLGVGLHIKTADSGQSAAQADADELVIEGSANAGLSILSGTSGEGSIHFGDSGASDIGQIMYDHNGNYMMFRTNDGEAMRIESDGQLLCGFTSQTNNSLFQIDADHTGTGNGSILSKCSGTGEVFHVHFQNGNGGVGGIKTDGSATAYATSSDYRLKENVSYSYDATTRLKQLKPARFNWIVDDTNTLLDGFLAHEVSSIVPEAITGTKDQTKSEAKVVSDANGNVLAIGIEEADWTQGKTDGIYASNTTWNATKTIPVYQGIDQAKLVPLLVKTVQELEARVKTLEDA